MNSPAGPGPQRDVVWSSGIDPNARVLDLERLPPPRPPVLRRKGLLLGAAAAVGVLAGVVTTWAEISPGGPPPDTPLWIAPGSVDRLWEVRPSSAAVAQSPSTTDLARVKMSELTVVPLSRRTTAGHSATQVRPKAPASRTRPEAHVTERHAPDGGPSPEADPTREASPSPSRTTTSDRSGKRGSPDAREDESSGGGSHSGKGSGDSGGSESEDSSGHGS
jgi:hypothetical protein